jgi:AcrR family transcriptional regulator
MRAMIEAALALFSEEGYAAVSTRRIAERAGCSETLLFRYFGDKRGLLLAICNDLGSERSERRSDETQDVREFIEHHLVETFTNLRRDAPSLKVVIAALINDPEMTADFEQRHDAAVEYIADRLRKFQDAGAIAPEVDITALASGIEQLSFAVGFFLQLVFERPEGEVTAIAKSFAQVVGQGLQAEAPRPLLEPRRRKAVAAAAEARLRLDNVIELLEDAMAHSDSGNGRARSSRRRAGRTQAE